MHAEMEVTFSAVKDVQLLFTSSAVIRPLIRSPYQKENGSAILAVLHLLKSKVTRTFCFIPSSCKLALKTL
jgi:hypothetical protein